MISRSGVAFIPEDRGIFPNLNVLENLTMAARKGTRGQEFWTLRRIFDIFPKLAERKNSWGNQLSGGEQQMLTISRGLMTNPDLLLLDEVTEGLAPLVREDIWRVIAEVKNSVIAIDNNDARFEAVHNAVPNLITLAAYRKIHFETESPYSVRFTWMHKHATKTLTKKMALAMLDKSASYSNPRMIDQHSWQALVAQEQSRVASLGDKEKLRIRRPTRVSPQVNVRYTVQNRYHVSAALPFILINPEPDVKLGTLSDYQKPESHPRKREYDFLVDRLYLEQVTE